VTWAGGFFQGSVWNDYFVQDERALIARSKFRRSRPLALFVGVPVFNDQTLSPTPIVVFRPAFQRTFPFLFVSRSKVCLLAQVRCAPIPNISPAGRKPGVPRAPTFFLHFWYPYVGPGLWWLARAFNLRGSSGFTHFPFFSDGQIGTGRHP